MKPLYPRPVYRGALERLWMYYFGYKTKMHPWHVNRLKKKISDRLDTEDYTCRLPRIKPRVRYKLRTHILSSFGEILPKRKVWK